ncbi:MAG: hypothetical protein MPW14_16520 [Candidatus Manganitrophus sp.]|nr:MAG: hypothetical protein MPW14_16520 [Candidatus Manganitrophus sp.]
MMFRDPAGFIQEKLSKKILSANTVRDAMMASFILTLQKSEEGAGASIPDPASWRQEKAREMREVASGAFAGIGAPFEYPTLPQMEQVKAEIERKYRWDQLDAGLGKSTNESAGCFSQNSKNRSDASSPLAPFHEMDYDFSQCKNIPPIRKTWPLRARSAAGRCFTKGWR